MSKLNNKTKKNMLKYYSNGQAKTLSVNEVKRIYSAGTGMIIVFKDGRNQEFTNQITAI